MIVKIPEKVNEDLAYLLGYITGDGCIHKPIKRGRGGYHLKITITCRRKRITVLKNLIKKIFDYDVGVYRDKRKNDSYSLQINSVSIYKYLTEIIGFVPGKKSGKIPKLNYVFSNRKLFANYLAGVIESDGHISDKYLAIIQKDRNFLQMIRSYSKQFLRYDFSEPKVNRVIDHKIVGWWIYSRKVKVFKQIVPLRY